MAGASSDSYIGSKPLARVRLGEGDVLEECSDGQSDGQCAGEFVTGWGSIVRHHARACACRPP